MSEANTPNNHPSEPDLSTNAENVYFSEDIAEMIPKEDTDEQLSKIKALSNYFEQSLSSMSDNLTTSEIIADDDLQPNQIGNSTQDNFAKNTDWFALARKLRQHNRELIKTVVQLEQALADSQEKLQSQIVRSRSADTLIAQQTEEIHTSQEQVTRLFHELEASHQTAQRQQVLIDNLAEKLQSSQEQVAQLERQCALLQESYNEQSQQIIQSEQELRDLRIRLSRQQRHTLQFKAALDRCLEVPGYATHLGDTPSTSITPISNSKTVNTSLIPKAQPIQPWSNQLEELESLKDISQDYQSTNNSSDIKISTSEQAQVQVELEKELEQHREPTEILVQPELNLPQPDLEVIEDEQEHLPNKLLDELDKRELEEPSSNQTILISQTNSPSPVIYPWRSPKKRKSMAAIELPQFPRYR